MTIESFAVDAPSLVDAGIPMRGELHVELSRRGFWLRWLPTFVSFIAGGALATAVNGRLDSLPAAVAGGALAIGALQALVLHRGAANWRWWVLAMPPLWATGWLVTWAGRIDVDQQFFNFGAYGAIAFTVLSGFLLVRLLRVPHSVGEVLRPAHERAR